MVSRSPARPFRFGGLEGAHREHAHLVETSAGRQIELPTVAQLGAAISMTSFGGLLRRSETAGQGSATPSDLTTKLAIRERGRPQK
jgi:hypothetical protein